jgi:opacity protein-like surface antigen
MKRKHYLIALLLLTVCSGALFAQEKEEIPKVEVFGGYALLHSEGSNLNGWKTGVGFTINRWSAIAVEADGYYLSETLPEGKLDKSEHSVIAGPHFSFRNKSKIVPFTYALAGVAWESRSLAGEKESGTGFAFETGGGLDWDVSKKVSIRLIDVGASVTDIAGNTTVKPAFTAGVVFKFGRK